MPERKIHNPHGPKRWWATLWFRVVAICAVLFVTVIGIATVYIARHVQPILKKRVVETLAARFHSPVELDSIDVSLVRGVQVHGTGLRILYLAGPDVPDASQLAGSPAVTPMLSVRDFTFRTSLRDLLHLRTRIATVYVEGMELHIPPHHGFHDAAHAPGKQPVEALVVDRIVCTDAKIIIETDKPGHDPLEFTIKNLTLTDVAANQPFLYTADLINAKPVGDIHSTGHFGPWQNDDPRETPVDGDYDFTHADLSTIKGISGTLSSTGKFSGVLGQLNVDGTTDTPNFALDISDHPVPLHTQFHAIVDGTTGDTTLSPVNAVLIHTPFTCEGTIAHARDGSGQKGHDIALTVNMTNGRIEDLLQLAMKSRRPVMSAAMGMHAKLHIPPGPERVAQKIEISGQVSEHTISFSNPDVQDKLDSLSMRAQGRPQDAHSAGSDRVAETSSQLTTNFALGHQLVTFNSIEFQLPGAQLQLDGVYSLASQQFDFKGHVRTQATASQMTTGWKSMLLKAVDPFLKKNGAGLQLPIEISGTKDDVHFGLDLHDKNAPPGQMASQLGKRH